MITEKGPGMLKTGAVYVLMLAATLGLFQWVRVRGAALSAPAPAGPGFGAAAAAEGPQPLLHVLMALVVIILAARTVGWLFEKIRQPAVIGEVAAGILLGPSLLGRIAPGAAAALLPASIAPALGLLAQVGIVLFMFLVGLELDTGLLGRRTHASVAISHASIITPFALGSLLALLLYPRLSTADVPFTVFALFMGVSMSVTAFPVLARILTDRGMQRTPLGVIALTCAAVDDVTAWCLLALVVSVARAQAGHALATAGLSLLFTAAMILIVRPLLERLVAAHAKSGELSQGMMAVVVVGLLLSALATEAIGIHALFGAFLFGAMIPHDSALAEEATAKLTDLVVVLFLPAFFAYTGLRTQIGLVQGGGAWALCALIVLTASAGKFLGSFAAARLTGLGGRDAAALGVLMNTRGLMELVVLNIGLDLKVISPTLFAMMVIMAVVTTFMTAPALHWLGRDTAPAAAPEAAA